MGFLFFFVVVGFVCLLEKRSSKGKNKKRQAGIIFGREALTISSRSKVAFLKKFTFLEPSKQIFKAQRGFSLLWKSLKAGFFQENITSQVVRRY